MESIWSETLSTLRSEVSEHHFNTWIRPIQVRSEAQESLVLEVPNSFYKDRIQQNYADLIRSKVRQISHSKTIDVSFVVQTPSPNAITSLRDLSRVKKELTKQDRVELVYGLNPKYRFETFVVGTSNQFAHAAAKAVGQVPGKTYNPLFIYGGVGLGKTHLITAVGNEIAAQNREARIIYRTGECFMNELAKAAGKDAV
ncbi:MAG: DnaA ATPase domain-containing protein, partial [Candidatus Paceibacterales bacterium]